jgi:diguanylate cyclase (GGDEF)-like protein
MSQKRRIALLSRDRGLHEHLELRLASKGYQAVSLPEPTQVLGSIYTDPPDVVIIDLTTFDHAFHGVLRDLKKDCYFNFIPVIGIINAAAVGTIAWELYPVDDFVVYPVNHRELLARILLSLQRTQRISDNSPLTKLPGNTSIRQAIDQALGKPMAVCFLDINDFKTYNDTYGFSPGDEVLQMVGRIVSNAVKESKDGGFVGHIGGDDFVFIVPMARADAVCRTIIANFNAILSDLFEKEEVAQRYYVARDRKGEARKVPLLSISIAVVPTDNPPMSHAGKVAELAADLKKLAKKSNESCYVINRRKSTGIEDCILHLEEE